MLYFLPIPNIKLSTLLPWRFASVTTDDLLCRDFQHETFNLLRTNTRDPDFYLLLAVKCIILSKSHWDSRSSVVAGGIIQVTPLLGEQFCPVVPICKTCSCDPLGFLFHCSLKSRICEEENKD